MELVVGDAREGHALGAFAECEAEGLRHAHGVVAEHLVEVAHAEKEDAIGVLGLESRELAHRGGVPRVTLWFGGGLFGHVFAKSLAGAGGQTVSGGGPGAESLQ